MARSRDTAEAGYLIVPSPPSHSGSAKAIADAEISNVDDSTRNTGPWGGDSGRVVGTLNALNVVLRKLFLRAAVEKAYYEDGASYDPTAMGRASSWPCA
jgi:hypothetical protein